MKLTKRILISSIALALLTPIVSTISVQPKTNIVVAAHVAKKKHSSKTGEIELVRASGHSAIPIVNQKGDHLKGKYAKSASVIKFYGKPVIFNIQYKINNLFSPIQINGKDFISLGDGGYLRNNVTGRSTKKGLKIVKTAYVYNQKGQRLKTYRGHNAILNKNTYVKYAGKQFYTIPQSFFNIGKNQYIAASYVARMNDRPLLTLNTNTYLYNRKGKRIGKNKLLQGDALITYSDVRTANSKDQYYFYQTPDENNKATSTFVTQKIKGQPYLSVGHGAYIKIANVQTADGMILYTKGPINVTLTDNQTNTVYNSDFKKTKQTLKAGKKLSLDQVKINNSLSKPRLYFRIKGSNRFIYWGNYKNYPGAHRTANFKLNYYDGASFLFRQFME